MKNIKKSLVVLATLSFIGGIFWFSQEPSSSIHEPKLNSLSANFTQMDKPMEMANQGPQPNLVQSFQFRKTKEIPLNSRPEKNQQLLGANSNFQDNLPEDVIENAERAQKIYEAAQAQVNSEFQNPPPEMIEEIERNFRKTAEN